jgi:ubiquinone/menaquinone biosynthesis C-methylase UbiE
MSKISDIIFVRRQHVCPWWLCFTFDNILRRLIHDPYKILRPYIKEGDKILDVGPGRGYFTVPLADMAGDGGEVIAADIQEKMLLAIKKRAGKSGLDKKITLHLSNPDSLNIKEKVNFVLAFWMMHEVPDRRQLLNELFAVLKDNGLFLLAEPIFHVGSVNFEETVNLAIRAGFTLCARPEIIFSRAVLFSKLTQ